MHECCPQEWRRVPARTGDYDFDAAIRRNTNRDLAGKLEMYLTGDAGYSPRTGYNGYQGYGGDD